VTEYQIWNSGHENMCTFAEQQLNVKNSTLQLRVTYFQCKQMKLSNWLTVMHAIISIKYTKTQAPI